MITLETLAKASDKREANAKAEKMERARWRVADLLRMAHTIATTSDKRECLIKKYTFDDIDFNCLIEAFKEVGFDALQNIELQPNGNLILRW